MLTQDIKVKLAGTGIYLPGNPITIDQVDDYLGWPDKAPQKVQSWLLRMKNVIREMLEVEFYHYAIDPVTKEFTEDNTTMSVKAAHKALEMADLKPEEVEFISYGSAHQDQMPTASTRIQESLGIAECAEISIHANCTSAYKALLVAYEFIKSGRFKSALVISSNMSSSELRADYYNQPIAKKEELFLRYFLSDGAGALVLKADEEGNHGLFVKHVYIESIGGKKPSMMMNKRPAYWMNPVREFEEGRHHLSQVFQDQLRQYFFDTDGSVFIKGLKRMIAKYHIDLSNLRYFQVNFPSRHISELIMEECEPLHISKDKLYTTMAGMGYAGPPMAFISLDNILRKEKLNDNDQILSFVTEVSKFLQAGYLLQKE